ncbi:glucose-methanol-choline oxidoreductase [Fusarium albosuccineum]|uniref:Glucose-methanol-choline oxidoreductase n=1 Tax=Fusarium albosuccineum TaxID=1237068 RepID=A0A8H4L339_9HYPO|nr:glucose-methanol-choline oxidoreductase [Fusarium albosuccineum]
MAVDFGKKAFGGISMRLGSRTRAHRQLFSKTPSSFKFITHSNNIYFTIPVITETLKAFDFIVVGGGTAGCVVAGRLAENPNVSVLVVEAGIGNPSAVDAITTPATACTLRGSRYDWAFKTGMIDRPEYTRIEKPNTRGKVLGGSSCLNYYTWIPGSAATFDDWAEFGGEGWTWNTCKDYIYKACFRDALTKVWTHAKQLIFESGRVVGVEVIDRDGGILNLRADYEVIVSLGVYETPKLLLLSGIGPKEELNKFNINTVVKSEHVGQNLLDHPILPHGPMTTGLLELLGLPRIDSYLEKAPEYVEFKKSNGNVDPFGPGGQPHFEIDFVPMFCDAFQWHIPTPPQGNCLTVIVDLLRPLSRNGTVTLKSSNPLEQAKINLNFFSNDPDLVAMRQGIRFVDDILLNGEGMKDIIEEDYPWAMLRTSDEAMDILIKERSQTGFRE